MTIVGSDREHYSSISDSNASWSVNSEAKSSIGGGARRVHLALKRALDAVMAGAALVILAPLLAFVAIAIKMDSPGPVLFSQVRWGRNGKKIRVFKFRSMRTDMGDASGVAQTTENDPRVTKIGDFLRRSNIDELPQLINVLKGDMSLIGPRCHPIGMLAANKLYEDLVPEYHQRHVMRPGITGLAQMRGLRGPTVSAAKARQRIAADIHYVENFTLWLDLKILIGTVRNELFKGSGF